MKPRISRNPAGGWSLEWLNCTLWTDPCDKVWNPRMRVTRLGRLHIWLGWLNFGMPWPKPKS